MFRRADAGSPSMHEPSYDSEHLKRLVCGRAAVADPSAAPLYPNQPLHIPTADFGWRTARVAIHKLWASVNKVQPLIAYEAISRTSRNPRRVSPMHNTSQAYGSSCGMRYLVLRVVPHKSTAGWQPGPSAKRRERPKSMMYILRSSSCGWYLTAVSRATVVLSRTKSCIYVRR